jgi:thiol-disulfide isomerase/thioredoxin
MKKTVLFILVLISSGFIYGQTDLDVLKKISGKISEIKNASYTFSSKCGEPNDSLFRSESNRFEVYSRNENDEYLKCNYYYGLTEFPDRIRDLYVNGVKKTIYWENKRVIVDSLNYDFLPYKSALVPIFIGTQGIIDYAIENYENVIVELVNFNDSIKIKIIFPDKVIECINYKPWIVNCPNIKKEDEHSSYTIWVDNNLILYKVLREVHTERCLSRISNLEYDTLSNKTLLSGAYIPDNFEVVDVKNIPINKKIYSLENKIAPNWSLFDPKENKTVSLNEIDSKLIILQFTGIGCGHCKESISFLKNLKKEYETDKLEIISIETFNDKPDYIKHYINLNGINYYYLITEKSVKNAYNVSGVPHFFILDQNKIIKKEISGYKKGETDLIIKEQIDKIID